MTFARIILRFEDADDSLRRLAATLRDCGYSDFAEMVGNAQYWILKTRSEWEDPDTPLPMDAGIEAGTP